MVEISYMPAKELIILEMVEYGLQEMADTCALLIEAGRPVVLNWAEGVAFHHQPLPFNTKELMKERLRGRIYWASVIYSQMPEYQSIIKVGTRDIPVLATPNPVLQQVARWMRNRVEKENLTGPPRIFSLKRE